MDKELIKLVGAYVVGGIILGFAGYMLVTTGEIPKQWMILVTAFAGFAFLGDAVRRTVVRRNNNRQ